MKKANKVCKGHFKGQRAWVWKINDFSPWVGPFGVTCYVISKFWSFKVFKAKKAAPIARKAKSHSSTSKCLKLLLLHAYAIIKLQKRPIWLCKVHTSLLKAKICSEGRKIKRYGKMIKNSLSHIFNTFQLSRNIFSHSFQNSGLQSTFWPLKGLCGLCTAKLAFFVV